jgi:hypothetical protein
LYDKQQMKRWVPDSVHHDGSDILGTSSDNRYPIPAMFGHYLFMPIVKGKSGMGTRMEGRDVYEAALRVK